MRDYEIFLHANQNARMNDLKPAVPAQRRFCKVYEFGYNHFYPPPRKSSFPGGFVA